jgi:hypothetical protein
MVKKIHTATKRKWKLSTHRSAYRFFHPVAKVNRPKTFNTEAAAHVWAKLHKMKEGSYTLKMVKNEKKFQVIAKKA